MVRKKTSPPSETAPAVEAKRSPTENPLVFISHDTRDADLAEAFGNLLTDASGGILKSFRSSDRKGTAGIEYGQEWYRAIMQKLDDATDVVALLTAHSLNRPWILYEAGVAKGKLSANDRVFGIALGVSLDDAATGPFAQFQNSPDEEDAITSLVLQLIRRHPQSAPREEAVRRQVQAFRHAVVGLLKDRKKEPIQAAVRGDETSVAKLYEEIKVLVRDMPERMASVVGGDPAMARARKRRRLHPMMFEEIFHHPLFRESPDQVGLPILMAFGLMRDEYPWLYELGVQLYRAVENGNAKEVLRARRAISQTIEMLRAGPLLHMMLGGPDATESMMLLERVMHSLDRILRIPKGLTRVDPNKADEKSE
jgi:hypothetical protein